MTVKISVPMLDSPLALRGKEGDIVREKKYEISLLSNLVKTEPNHATSRTKFLLLEIKNTTKYL